MIPVTSILHSDLCSLTMTKTQAMKIGTRSNDFAGSTMLLEYSSN